LVLEGCLARREALTSRVEALKKEICLLDRDIEALKEGHQINVETPPAEPADERFDAFGGRKRKVLSEEARRKISESQARRWEMQRKFKKEKPAK
jgi:hypothetical protein